MRPIEKTCSRGNRGDTKVTPDAPMASPRKLHEINRLGGGVAGVTPKIKCKNRNYKYTDMCVLYARAYRACRFGVTRDTREPNPLFLLINWGDPRSSRPSPPVSPTQRRTKYASG